MLVHPASMPGAARTIGSPGPAPTADRADDGLVLTARATSRQITAGDSDVAITITVPAAGAHVRPPVALAIVIDTSGSMTGPWIAHAKAAAAKLVDALEPGDAFAVVTYASEDVTIVPMGLATAGAKASARSAIDAVGADGGTCISCGITRGAAELAHPLLQNAVERIVLISDGQATVGIRDRDELVAIAASTAARGVSISTVGVGIDFDELTMMRLAATGRGNYYYVDTTDHLAAMFDRELGGLAATVAADVRLVLTDGQGASIQEAYGYPFARTGTQVVIPIADLRAGETRKVVVRTHVTAPTGPLAIADVQLSWRRVADGVGRRAKATALATVTTDQRAVATSIDLDASAAAEQAVSARALEDATRAYEERGPAAAQQILDRRVESARAKGYLSPTTMSAIESDAHGAASDFAAAPAPRSAAGAATKKAMRVKSYELAR